MEIVFKRQQIVALTFAWFAAGTNEAGEVECKVGAESSRSELVLAGVLIDQWHIDFLLNGLISAGVGEVVASPSRNPTSNVASNDRTRQACCRDGWHLKVDFICHRFWKSTKNFYEPVPAALALQDARVQRHSASSMPGIEGE